MATIQELEAAKVAAYKASDRASNTGGVVFTSHTGHGAALKSYAAAKKAWFEVSRVAQQLLKANKADAKAKAGLEDAQARIGELDIARKMVTDDLASHITLTNVNRGRPGAPAAPGGKPRIALQLSPEQQGQLAANLQARLAERAADAQLAASPAGKSSVPYPLIGAGVGGFLGYRHSKAASGAIVGALIGAAGVHFATSWMGK